LFNALAKLLGCRYCGVDVERFFQPCVNGSVEKANLQLPGINARVMSFRIIHSISVNMFSHVAHLTERWERFVKFIDRGSHFDGEFWDPDCYLG
jgi:hypothetical protein